MARTAAAKGKMVIAGPGAGKTHNMVEAIINALPDLEPCRYMAVITYTNSATTNILNRLSRKITIPPNLFVGTMHSFLNRFIIIPFASFDDQGIAKEKLFMQCGIDDVFLKVEKMKTKDKRSKTPQDAAIVKSGIKKRLAKLGYITFDQTLSIAKSCMTNAVICHAVSNRLQFLFVDEFQDSGNDVFEIIENLRGKNRTKIYCVGDPEQYIQSFDSSIRQFKYIPILKASQSKGYEVSLNNNNFRSTVNIVNFLNEFNGRSFDSVKFVQAAQSKDPAKDVELGEQVMFIKKAITVTPIIDEFNAICDKLSIPISGRCILAKKNDVITRVTAALGNRFMNPKKNSNISPIKAIQDTLLTTLQMNQTTFCETFQADIYTLRKYAVAIFKAINNGTITNENTYGAFVSNVLKLTIKEGLPVKIENLKFDYQKQEVGNMMTVSNIHVIKGLEAESVLAIAKTEQELLLWIETDSIIRETKRDNETTDYPRLGYVAFSRAERLLCISCLEAVSDMTIKKLEALKVDIRK